MKKTLVTVLLSCVAVGAFAQGAVQFRGYWASTTPPVDARVYLGTVGSATLLDSSNPLWRAALIGGPTAGAIQASASVLGNLSQMYYSGNTTVTYVGFNTGTTAPRFSGTPATGSQTAYIVPGVDWGGTALVQMVAWQGNYSTWAEAWAAAQTNPNVLIGVSNPLTLTLPSSSTSTAATYLWGLQSFAIAPVPEPTTFALAGLGAAALLIFRRRS